MTPAAKRLHSDGREDVVSYDTIDEAIAAALAEVGPGGIVVIHDADCEQHGADEEHCSCNPLELRIGAEA